MIEVVGITTEWECRMRAIKRSIIKAFGDVSPPNFTCVYVSSDIAEEIQRSTKLISEVGHDTTFEQVPLKVDHELPDNSVVYIWEGKNV
jgi:hypothetical protein